MKPMIKGSDMRSLPVVAWPLERHQQQNLKNQSWQNAYQMANIINIKMIWPQLIDPKNWSGDLKLDEEEKCFLNNPKLWVFWYT